MSRDKIIRMAREAGLVREWMDLCKRDEEALDRFAALVRADEREACARACEGQDEADARFRYDYRRGVCDCVDAIRARSNT